MTDKAPRQSGPATRAVQALGWEDDVTGAVVRPVHVATTFARDDQYELPDGRTYGRDGNPTPEQPEALLADLEGAHSAMLFASGLAACTAAFHCLSQGDHVIAPKTMYHGTYVWLKKYPPAWGIDVTFIEPGNLTQMKEALRPGKTKIVWIETPSNPTWLVTDIAGAAEIAHSVGAQLIVDSTCATPALSQPLSLGADIVCHSATKYLNGHSDVLAGALAAKEDTELWQKIREYRLLSGAVLGAFDAFLLLRGMRTLFVRMERHCENALRVAQFLSEHPAVTQVRYPGLESDPGHNLAAMQMRGGFGGMLSFHVKGGAAGALKACSGLVLIKRATSLGGVESLIEHRYSIEPAETKVPEDMLRLSVGIEAAEDLIADLKYALDAL